MIALDAVGVPRICVSASTDGDGWADSCDNCPTAFNLAQFDSDSDGTGDPCEPAAIAGADRAGNEPFEIGNDELVRLQMYGEYVVTGILPQPLPGGIQQNDANLAVRLQSCHRRDIPIE